MNIPEKAVEAAVRAAFFEDCGDSGLLANLPDDERAVWYDECRVILKAAAPFIAAQTLRDFQALAPNAHYFNFADLLHYAKDLEAGK